MQIRILSQRQSVIGHIGFGTLAQQGAPDPQCLEDVADLLASVLELVGR